MTTPEHVDPVELFLKRLGEAEARIEHGNDERTAGADDKARLIEAEVTRRGRGGAMEVAALLMVSKKTVSQAVARAARTVSPLRGLPHDTLDRLLAAELAEVPPLPTRLWAALAWIVRSIYIDVVWFGEPNMLLAAEVEDSDLGEEDIAVLAGACHGLSRVQALAVIDACQTGDLSAFPTTESSGTSR
ncbi:hypothetical protein [Streptomyces sp. NBC_01568]|uniref:hypothetical protein n=1 Tax=Streptomyces sp. NBC_01568 TaxID=2975882 RepID=UPI002F91AFEB